MSDWATFTALDDVEQAATVIATLREVVAERGGDYVYVKPYGDGCVYVAAEQPSCLVGVALHRLGIDLDTLHRMDRGEFGGGAGIITSGPGVGLGRCATQVLGAAQNVQDDGRPWSEALAGAEQTYDYITVL